MKTAFVTHCSDDWFYNGGCNKLLATAAYFHPEIPFFVFNNIELSVLVSKYPGLGWDILNPIVSLEVARLYERVVHIDADSIILGKLDDLLTFDTDIAVVRNNNDYNTASKFSDKPITINGCIPEMYFNAGLIASNTRSFWEYWIVENKKGRGLPFQEQDVLNLIVQENKFSYTVLDSKDKKQHYGISCHYGEHTFWDSSKEIIKKGEDFMLKDKKIKVYHQAGGHHHFPKLNLHHLFNNVTAKQIEDIIANVRPTYRKIVL